MYEDICAEKRREIQQLDQELERLKTLLASGWSAEDEHPERLADASGTMELTREIVDAMIQIVRVFDDGQIELEWKSRNNFGSVSAAAINGIPV